MQQGSPTAGALLLSRREGLTGGVYWIPRLSEEVGKADVVLLLLGETIGRWQELEYYEALQLSRLAGRGDRPRIIPVVIAQGPAPGLAFLSTLHQVFALAHEGAVKGASFDKDERRILSWSWDHTLRLWDAATGQQIGPAMTHEDAVYGASFDKDERRDRRHNNHSHHPLSTRAGRLPELHLRGSFLDADPLPRGSKLHA